MCKFTKATDYLKERSKKMAIHHAMQDMERLYQSWNKNKYLSITSFNQEQNRAKLLSILKTIFFLWETEHCSSWVSR